MVRGRRARPGSPSSHPAASRRERSHRARRRRAGELPTRWLRPRLRLFSDSMTRTVCALRDAFADRERPLDDRPLLHGHAEPRHRDRRDAHTSSASAALSARRPRRPAPGRDVGLSSTLLKGTGAWGAVTRFTGAFRKSKPRSTQSAATSLAIPQRGVDSSTTTTAARLLERREDRVLVQGLRGSAGRAPPPRCLRRPSCLGGL